MIFDIFTIFPKMFDGPFSCGTLRVAMEKGFVNVRIRDLREFTDDPHKKVDDYPYGGGPGMVLKAEPIFRGVRQVKSPAAKVILLSPGGKLFTQEMAKELARESHLIFICGRYQGVDERVRTALVDLELSIGNYVLSGGELACMVVVESIVRLLPGVLKNPESIASDSSGELDSPLYTRPREVEGIKVPDVLVSGHHKKIKAWRESRKKRWATK